MREKDQNSAAALLAWYDANARVMPWRVSPCDRQAGVLPDPYHVWLSEVMLQQTTVAAVDAYFRKFLTRWPRVQDLANARDADVMAAWAGLGYYARARNLLKCARVVTNEYGGVFPETQVALQKLPGIGPYTSAAIAAIAFDQRAVVLDGNVERVMARLFRVEQELPAAKEPLRKLADRLTPAKRCGDYAQAVMDLGATICTPRNPACGICPWMQDCAARKMGDAASFPRKAAKTPKPVRRGTAFIALNKGGQVLLQRRPDKGLLGGMLGWPGNTWAETPDTALAPVDANWKTVGEVRHTFTHFHLVLEIRLALDVTAVPKLGSFRAEFDPNDLPTVMRKGWDLVQTRLSG